MKRPKIYSKLLWGVYLPLLILLGSFVILYPKLALLSTRISFAFCIFFIIFLLGPIGSKKLGNAPASFNYNLIKLTLFQLGVLFTFYAMFMLCSVFLAPSPQIHPIQVPQTFQRTLHASLWLWGLYPWVLYSLVAVMLAYYNPQQKYPMSLFIIVKHLFGSRLKTIFALGGEIFIRQGLFFSVGISIGLIAFILGMLANHISQHFLPQFKFRVGPNFSTLSAFSLIYILFMTATTRDYIRHLWQKRTSAGKLLLLQTLAIAAIAFFSGIFFEWLLAVYNVPQPSYHTFKLLISTHWHLDWQLFYWAWALGLTPLIAGYMARYLQGLRLRSGLVLSLILPLLTGWLLQANSYAIRALSQTTPFLTGIAIIYALLLISFFLVSRELDDQTNATLYKDKTFQKKRRIPFKITQGMLQILMIVSLFYLLSGLTILHRFFYAMNATCVVVYLVVLTTFTYKSRR